MDMGLLRHWSFRCGHNWYSCLRLAPVAQLVECLLLGMGCHGFDPGLRHIKVVKNGTSCSSLGTQAYAVELGLVSPVSRLCDWVLYHFKCLGHDTSLRQHYKSEHWVPYCNQTPSWDDWKIVEMTLNPNKQQQQLSRLWKDIFFQTSNVKLWN